MATSEPSTADVNRLEVSCRSCGAELTFMPHMRTAQCPYCASTSVVERPPSKDRPEPAFVLGFILDQDRAARAVQSWVRRRGLFARSDFKKAAIELTRGVYLPAYIYGATARTRYSAEIGENYTEVETYVTTDSKGRTVVRTRTVTKTEWRSLEGNHSCYVLDVVVTASKGLANEELEAIEPFDLRALRRYLPAILSGWLAEDPSLARDECFHLAREESTEKVGKMLENFMPGDSHSDLRYSTELSDEVIDLVLLPIWSFAAIYDRKKPAVRILVNGQTGAVAGRVPLSALKIALAVLVVLVPVVALILFLAQQ